MNLLKNIEIVECLARAPERKAFYVDVGELTGKKAQQYLEEQMKLYKNKFSTSEVANKKQLKKRKKILEIL